MINIDKYSLQAKILSLKLTGQVGPRTFAMLMEVYRTVDSILFSEAAELIELDGIGPSRSQAISLAHEKLDEAEAHIESLKDSDTNVVTSLDDDYPHILHELNDPPMLLFYKGALPSESEKRVAIIGSQEVSAEGIGDAVELSRNLAENDLSIISGLARGIDTAGHIGAMKCDGKTYAVLPSGFNQIHPAENRPLVDEIIKTGGLLSEFLPDTPTNAGRLMSRNRITIGLADAVIIGEVAESSVGTLDAAKCCHQLGKLLFVIASHKSAHFEKLLGYGAIPLMHIDEYQMILKAMV